MSHSFNLEIYYLLMFILKLSDVQKDEEERLNEVQLAKPSRLPILPPKVRNENSPKIGDLIHQRLLPRDNCVTNILYSRRLPSPPVYRRPAASPAERHHHFSQGSVQVLYRGPWTANGGYGQGRGQAYKWSERPKMYKIAFMQNHWASKLFKVSRMFIMSDI